MSSPEFLEELEKTKKVTDKACKQFGYEYHLLYSRRYCS